MYQRHRSLGKLRMHSTPKYMLATVNVLESDEKLHLAVQDVPQQQGHTLLRYFHTTVPRCCCCCYNMPGPPLMHVRSQLEHCWYASYQQQPCTAASGHNST
jgi:hypothetical protein